MPKKVVSQKQKQRQSIVVNVNLAKAKARAKAKKSRGKRSSVMMQPPPIYASPINNLIPAMYGSQGQQIQPKSTEELLKSFLSKAEPSPVTTWNTLGSAPASSVKNSSIKSSPSKSISTPSTMSPNVSSLGSFKSLGGFNDNMSDISDISEGSLNTQWARFNDLIDIGENIRRDEIQDLRGSQLREQLKNKNMPTPFQNEERTYLKASEPDNESTAPKFSDKAPESFYETLDRIEARTKSDINNLLEPRRPDRRPPVRVQLDEEASLGSYQQSDPLNPFPEKMYNKMMGYF